MTPEHAPNSDGSPRLNPAALAVEDAAKLLTKAGGVRISVEQIRADIEADAPINADGTINLVHYAAWLVREMATEGATIGIDPRQLRPSELCQLLNSTPIGEVISDRHLRRHRTRAGLRIAASNEPQRVDLLRFVAWLINERHKPKQEPEGLTGYDAQRERVLARSKAQSLSGRDIGELPEVVDPDRKGRAERDFRFFCETYFKQTFTMAWSDDHLKVIAKIEQAVLEGGLFAMAMPRGSGKTTLCEMACLWAILIGARRIVVRRRHARRDDLRQVPQAAPRGQAR
ncbi:MAG: hypothetical protein JKX70_06420 [Phycisphaerales bacterium]|nr:hypothetical protein [Phycisphaerales bacterium]